MLSDEVPADTLCSGDVLQGLADHFGVCGEVTAVRIVGDEGGSRKAWLEFSSHRESRAAREYDQTVRVGQFTPQPHHKQGLGSLYSPLLKAFTYVHCTCRLLPVCTMALLLWSDCPLLEEMRSKGKRWQSLMLKPSRQDEMLSLPKGIL